MCDFLKRTGLLKVAFISIFLSGCGHDYTPKPRGYFRIEFPEKKYVLFNPPDCPFSFDIPDYGKAVPFINRFSEPCWMDVAFERFNGNISLSYKPLHNNLQNMIEGSRTLVYKHTVKADAINEKLVEFPANHVYGILYEIDGDAASAVQFFATDSVSHFLRGALYFNVEPKSDSLAPVISYLREDIMRMMASLKWK